MRRIHLAGATFGSVAALLAGGAALLGACTITPLRSGGTDGGSADGSMGDAAGNDGPSGDSNPSGDGPSGDEGGTGCATYAAAVCDRYDECEPGYLTSEYGTQNSCVTLLTSLCEVEYAAPGTGVTDAFLSKCTAALNKSASACAASGPLPDGILTPTSSCNIIGTGTGGAACGVDAQCATDTCTRAGTLCGQCTASAASGAPCGPGASATCTFGQTCGSKNTCVPQAAVGDACDFGASIGECVSGTDCVVGDGGATTGTCQASGVKTGTACNPNGVGSPKCWASAGFFCDPATNQCAAITYGASGASCGMGDAGVVDNSCSNGACVAGACAQFGASGASCTVGAGAGCAQSLECVVPPMDTAGTCTAVSTTCAPSDAGTIDFDFAPSNVSLATILSNASTAQAENVASSCAITTDTASPSTCLNSPISVVTQLDGSTVNLIVVSSLTVQTTGSIDVTGTVPLVIVSLSDVTFLGGNLQGNSTSDMLGTGGPGGGPGGTTGAGGGAGGGPSSSQTAIIGGGGGSYCGVGGAGGGGTQSTFYGGDEIRPLVGGSGGGSGAAGAAGFGGGGVQIVATGAITIPAGAYITVSGGGGDFSGDGCAFQNGGGGGSGGSLLLEAPTVTVGGILAANGGGGGGAIGGTDGWDDTSGTATTPAPGGTGAPTGGAGGAGATTNGTTGATGTTCATTGIPAGGGGGGAGRIRINSSAASATVTGTVSPAATTPCLTQGGLRGVNSGP
jgi:hypothetical protein